MTPKATPTVARLSATARAASSGARTMMIIISRVTSVIAMHDQRDPFPGDRVVVGQLRGAAGDARFDVGFLAELLRRRP